MPLLEIRDLKVTYDRAVLLNGVTLQAGQQELVGVVGPNGAGKSTLLRAISGLVLWEKWAQRGTRGEITLEGQIIFNGERIDSLPPHEVVRRGLLHCPERRRPFRELTVLENLRAGGYRSSSQEIRERLDQVYQLFPVLYERRRQIAGTLSGGEQQMLAIGRALMYRPKLLCIDEPSLGLGPKICTQVFDAIAAVHKTGIPILVVEQDVSQVFRLADRNYILSQGRVVSEGSGARLTADDTLRATYLGL